MLLSLALIFLVGLALASIFERIKIPRIIGLLLTGIILGPYVLDLIDPTVLNISSELRTIALIIILIKAGLSLNIKDLKKVGRPAVLMSFLPASFEILAYTVFAPLILGISTIEGAVMGAVMGAVSPAVVVPRMVNFIEKGYGTKKSIPQMILAGASMDDVFVIVLFSTFIAMAQGQEQSIVSNLANVPVSIVLGIIVGGGIGWLLSLLIKANEKIGHDFFVSKKALILLALSFLLVSVESLIKNTIAFSGLLAVMSMAVVLKLNIHNEDSQNLSGIYGKLWVGAEVVLFVLVGSAINIDYLSEIGFAPIAMILIALLIRSLGVFTCLIGTKLSFKEKLFCIISYLPKATVQAAIGAVPLSLGLDCGNIVLTVAVIGIVITAPLGAIGIDYSYKKLLTKD